MNSYEVENPKWWVQRWNDLLNSYRFKKRLERGRKYAKEGNILHIGFAGSQVVAKVQGTAAEPYDLSIAIDPFSKQDWNYVTATMAKTALYSAQLLAGEMPDDIESVFIANGLSLFPFTIADVHSQCSCPDPRNPCKHIAAVYYQLSDLFSEDPFILFQLRGRTKEQILEALRKKRAKKIGEMARLEDHDNKDNSLDSPSNPGENSPPTTLNLEQFWQYSEPLDSSLVVITPPTDNLTVLDVLGNLPLTDGEVAATRQFLKGAYQTASQQGVISALNRE